MVTKLTRKAFADACKIPNNILTILSKRGKIVINSARCSNCDGKKKPCNNCKELEFIDLDYRTKDGFYTNLDFYNKSVKGIEPVKQIKIPKVKEKKTPTRSVSVPVVLGGEKDVVSDNNLIDLSETSSEDALTRANKFKQYQNKEADLRLKELEESKMRGELIPIDLVKEMITIFAESVKRAYLDSGENLIMIISERLQAQEHDKAFMRSKLLESTNKAIDDSVDASQKRIEPNESE